MIAIVPAKIRQLEADLKKAGFVKTAGKGSHRKWKHPSSVSLVLSGQGGDDAKPYQEKDVAQKIEEATGE
jgi:predicted RNA binding protein YcfA (HicA-like mRNA interferase family)